MADWIESEIARRESEAEQRERDRKDAERWRWVRNHFIPSGPKLDGKWTFHFELKCYQLTGQTMYEAIDAAMEAERKERGE